MGRNVIDRVIAKLRRQLKVIMVDESQDTDQYIQVQGESDHISSTLLVWVIAYIQMQARAIAHYKLRYTNLRKVPGMKSRRAEG